MKALILRGKYKGKICEVSQWCNDWFMLDSSEQEIARKPFSPSSLAFTLEGITTIKEHKNNGILFGLFTYGLTTVPYKSNKGEVYQWTFRKRK